MYALFIEGTEWIIIILLFLILIVGSKKLPEISRNIGRAVGEYQRTRKSLEREIDRVNRVNIKIAPVRSEREKLERIADALNIDYRDKTDDELKELIQNRLKEI